MKILIALFAMSLLLGLTVTLLSKPSLEETTDFLNRKNFELYNIKTDLQFFTFDQDAISSGHMVIRLDSESGEFKNSVNNLNIICLANALYKIKTISNYTPLTPNATPIDILSLEFSKPCKIGDLVQKQEYDNLETFHSNEINIYFGSWSKKDFKEFKSAIVNNGDRSILSLMIYMT